MLKEANKDQEFYIMVMEVFHMKDGSKMDYLMEQEKHTIKRVKQLRQIGQRELTNNLSVHDCKVKKRILKMNK